MGSSRNRSRNEKYVTERNTQERKKSKMAAEQQQRSGCGKLVAGATLVAAGAGAYYYHKDMTQEELREAGELYVEKTKEYSVKAYETAKPYAILAAEKAVEGSKCAYAKLMALLYPEEQSEIDASTFEEPEDFVEEETQVDETAEVESEGEDEVRSEL